jgi:L-lactate dehydrogenase complex protein LldG
MSDGRFNVMAAVAQRLRAGALPPAGRVEHPGNMPTAPSQPSTDELIVHFTREAEALTVVVHRVDENGAAVARVTEIVADRAARRVLAWDEQWLNCPGLGSALMEAGIALESCRLPRDGAGRRERLAQLDDVAIGLTGAVAGLADTGSLVLVSGPGRARIASLLPPVHVAVLRVEQLYPTYAAFLAAHPRIEDTGSNLVLVTGPSRTADIEMTLTRGVHGPGEVHVVLIG